MSLTPGTRLGVYEVTAQIGAGGMGEVYRATDSDLKRSVASTFESMYASLPTVVCQGLCAASCGPIACSQAEADRMAAAAGRPLEFTSGLTCGYLDDVHRRCTVYAVRPLICRLWGVATDMVCPWGCQPAPAPVERADVRRLIQLSAIIGGDLVVASTGKRHDQGAPGGSGHVDRVDR